MTAESTPSRREPTPRWERRYREVLGVAATAFAEKGYLGASIKDIADRLGVRQASLYYYFSSKEAALAAICELGVKDFIANLHQILAQDIPTADKIRAAVANHLQPLRTKPHADYIKVFYRHRQELPNDLRQGISTLAREYQSLIERLFEEGVQSGELRSDLKPKIATLALMGLCNSVIASRTHLTSQMIDELIEEHADFAIHGCIQPSSKSKRSKREESEKENGS